jgi:thiamine biosynthesis lipoprotein ApbE
MVMDPDEIEEYCRRHPDVAAMIILQAEDGRKEEVLCFGSWENDVLL